VELPPPCAVLSKLGLSVKVFDGLFPLPIPAFLNCSFGAGAPLFYWARLFFLSFFSWATAALLLSISMVAPPFLSGLLNGTVALLSIFSDWTIGFAPPSPQTCFKSLVIRVGGGRRFLPPPPWRPFFCRRPSVSPPNSGRHSLLACFTPSRGWGRGLGVIAGEVSFSRLNLRWRAWFFVAAPVLFLCGDLCGVCTEPFARDGLPFPPSPLGDRCFSAAHFAFPLFCAAPARSLPSTNWRSLSSGNGCPLFRFDPHFWDFPPPNLQAPALFTGRTIFPIDVSTSSTTTFFWANRFPNFSSKTGVSTKALLFRFHQTRMIPPHGCPLPRIAHFALLSRRHGPPPSPFTFREGK